VKVCAIVPAYNEAASISEIIQETKKHVDLVIVVDDASIDNTAEVARQNGAHVICRRKNHGPGTALQIIYEPAELNGIDYTTFDFIVHIDSDGQHDPRCIPGMLEIAQSCDIVIASRFLNASHKNYASVRKIGISFFTSVINLVTRADLTDVTSGFRIYNAKSLQKLSPISTRHWAIEQTLEALKKGLKIKEASVEMPVRTTGDSQFSLATYIGYPFKMILAILKVILFK
jgi:glycosyltransferase involved in cell wall biosynthesis